MADEIDSEFRNYQRMNLGYSNKEKKIVKLEKKWENLEDEKFRQDEEIRALCSKLKSMKDLDDKFLEVWGENQKLEFELEKVRKENAGIVREIELLEIGQKDLKEELQELLDREKSRIVYCKNCRPSKPKKDVKNSGKLEVKKTESGSDSVYLKVENEAVNELYQPIDSQDFITLEPQPCVIGQIQPNGTSKEDCITSQLNGQIQDEATKSSQDFLKLAQKIVKSSIILKNRRAKLCESDKSIKFPVCPDLSNLTLVNSSINSILSNILKK